MASLFTRTFTALVQQQAAAMQARCAQLIDFSVGSILRAVVEANAALSLWLQGEMLRLLKVTRAATSTGTDLDTFVGDFGLTRLGVQFSLGEVTFARFTASAQAVVPIGAVVRTGDQSRSFQVVLDPANTTYNAGLGGYVVPVGVLTISVPVKAVEGGAASNVVPNSITVISGAIPYIDTVTNAAAFQGGGDAESDASLRLRFIQFIASLSKATRAAIAKAVADQASKIRYTITENRDPATGDWRPGFFYVGIEDGSGTATALLVSQVYAAVDLVRADTVTFAVFAGSTVAVDVSLAVVVAPGYLATEVRAAIGTAIRANIEALGIGAALPYTKIAQWAYEASAGITAVNGITINGERNNLTPTALQTLRPNIIAVS